MNRFLITLLLILLSLASYSQNTLRNVNLIVTKADSLFELGDFISCMPLYKMADSIYKISQEKKSFYCQCRLAESLTRQGKLEQSEKIALKAFETCPVKYRSERCEVLNALGMINLQKGRQDVAEKFFNESLDFIKSENNSLSKAKSYDNIGLLNWIKGNQAVAEEYLLQAMEIRKATMGEMSASVASSYNNLGLIYSNTNPKSSLEYYTKALEIYKSIYPFNHPNIALALNNIGIIQRKEGDTETSIHTFEKSLEIWSAQYGKNHSTIAFIYSNLGESYLENGDTKTALDFQFKALDVYQKVFGPKHPEIAVTYNSIANIYSRNKNFKMALEYFQKALCANHQDFQESDYNKNPSLKNYSNPDVLLVTLLLKAKTLESFYHEKTLKLKDLETALNTLEKSDSLLTQLRQIRTSNKDKIELGKIGSEVYENGISIAFDLSQMTLKKNYYLHKAFYFSERNKGAVLHESIADAEAKSFAGIPDSILKYEQSIKNEISYLEQKLAQGTPEEEGKLYRNRLFTINMDYDKLIKKLESTYPEYYNLKFNSKTITIPELQNTLCKNEAILSYFLSEERKRIFVFQVTKNKFKVLNLPLPEGFEKKVALLKNSIKFKVYPKYLSSSYELKRILIPQTISKKINKLIIVPEGKLGSIPFEALLMSKGNNETINYNNLDYLIRRFAVSYNYSSLLFYNSRESLKVNKTKNSSILLCAPVNFPEDKGLNTLKGSEEEIKKIDSLFTNKNFLSTSILYSNANEKRIKNEDLTKYKFIHLATHGVVNEEQPELSQIFLSIPEDQSEDGDLFSGEIYGLKIDAELTILSACQTGLGKIKKGEGIIGLSRALIYAGTKNVMVSLWTVSDASTSDLMVKFYTKVVNDQTNDYSIALQQSKLKLIKEGKFTEPFYWAPFIFIGK